MKIALVSPYDFAYPGGVANHISALEQQFTKKGHEVKIIAPASGIVSHIGSRFIAVGKPRPIPASGSIARIVISPWLSSQIKTVLTEEKFDVVHLHEPLMPMLCTTVLRLSQALNIGTFHASGARPWYNIVGGPFGKLLLKKWFRKLDGKIAVSPPARNYISKYFPGYYNIVPNGIDIDRFSPDVSPIEKFCDEKLNILFVGRLEKRKGLNHLLEAYKWIEREIPECRLIVIGPGTRLRKKYEKQVRKDGLKNVVFSGFVSYDELPRYYKTADVVCSPATGRESFGIVLLEAMAVGKPIVASNIEGYATVVTHGVDGLLVPPKDGNKLAQALLSLLIDKSLRRRLGDQGRVKVQNYSWERIAQRILDYYMRILKEPPWNERFLELESAQFKSERWLR